MATLIINPSDTYHQECPKAGPYQLSYCDTAATHCPACGAEFTTLSSDYTGIENTLRRIRPDLTPFFPWEGFWETDEAKELLAKLDLMEEE